MQVPSPEKKVKVDTLHLTSNPLKWSVNEVVKFLKTTDCANLARICKEQVSFSMSEYVCLSMNVFIFRKLSKDFSSLVILQFCKLTLVIFMVGTFCQKMF